ncbi:hypothetical protein ACJX0J_011887 [Zea mays]
MTTCHTANEELKIHIGLACVPWAFGSGVGVLLRLGQVHFNKKPSKEKHTDEVHDDKPSINKGNNKVHFDIFSSFHGPVDMLILNDFAFFYLNSSLYFVFQTHTDFSTQHVNAVVLTRYNMWKWIEIKGRGTE